MLTQPDRWRIDKKPWCLVDIKEKPYIINPIKDKLFEVLFLSWEDFSENVNNIITEWTKTIKEVFYTDDPKFLNTILSESIENIGKHAFVDKNTQQWVAPSTFSLKKGQLQYTVEISNVCEEADFKKLESIAESINTSSIEDIKTAYAKQMMEGKFSEKNWAWLGLLTMAKSIKRSNKNRKFTIITVEEIWRKELPNQSEKALITIKITINIPFPEPKDSINDHRTDDETSLHKSA